MLTAAGLTLTLVPFLVLAVALVARFGAHYFPAGDVAGIEVRVRDVGRHPVLLGLYSRDRWSHPGPASFYALALPYRLSGGSSVSLNIGALLINGGSIAAVALIARRLAGVPVMLLTLVGCGVLVHSFGPSVTSSPWNPDMPVFPFAAVIFLTWAMLCGDTWALPLGAVATTFCVQTHIGYMLLAVPVFLLGLGGLLLSARQRPVATRARLPARRLVWAGTLAGLVLAVMWLPPVIQQIDHSSLGNHGNLGNIVDYFTHPSEPLRHSFAQGYRLVSGQFGLSPEWTRPRGAVNVFAIEPTLLDHAPIPIWLVAYALAITLFWRRRAAVATRLAITVSLVLVLGVVWVARTPGIVYTYRVGWTWILAMTVFLVIAWAAWTIAASGAPHAAGPAGAIVCGAALLVLAVVNSIQALGVKPDAQSRVVASLTRQVTANLPTRGGDVIARCDGDEGCIYDAGLFLALEKRGVRVRSAIAFGLIGGDARHLVHRTGPIRATLDVKVGDRFDEQQHTTGSRLVAYWGEQPLAERTPVVEQGRALDDAYKAGLIDARTLILRKVALPHLGTAVGVFIHEPDATP
jgi:hypothetical protein